MVKTLRTLLCCLLCALLMPAMACAEECFQIDVDTLDMTMLNDSAYVLEHLSSQTQGLRVRKYISDSSEIAAKVRLTITQGETGSVVYDKNYGYVSGVFDSGDIYLPFIDNNTIPYLITLNIEDWTYALPFMQQRSRLNDNSACTYGLRLRDANPSLTGGWLMGTMLDLNSLRSQGSTVLPVCASNLYAVGLATVTLTGNSLAVTLDFDVSANVQVKSSAVYLIGNVADMTTADPAAMSEPAYAVGQAIDVGSLQTALLYVPIALGYNPAGLSEFYYDAASPEIAQQWALWVQNLQGVVVTAEPAATQSAMPTDTPQPDETVPEELPQYTDETDAQTATPEPEPSETPAPLPDGDEAIKSPNDGCPTAEDAASDQFLAN